MSNLACVGACCDAGGMSVAGACPERSPVFVPVLGVLCLPLDGIALDLGVARAPTRKHSRKEPRMLRCLAFCFALAPVAVSLSPDEPGRSLRVFAALLGGTGLGLKRI